MRMWRSIPLTAQRSAPSSPAYARPALAVGNTRFVLYNRAGKELTVQSRTRQLYAKSL